MNNLMTSGTVTEPTSVARPNLPPGRNPKRLFGDAARQMMRKARNLYSKIRRRAMADLYRVVQDHAAALTKQACAMEQLQEELAEKLARLQTELTIERRRLTGLLTEVQTNVPQPLSERLNSRLRADSAHELDAFYCAFEDKFRGSREDIKERVQFYLPLLREAGLGTAQMPILDLGCGRGEWLEVLRDEGMLCSGVDMNRIFLEQCRQRGLPVSEGDALQYIKSAPAGSLGMVSGFHIIEHLPFNVLVELLDETVRVLKPGGMALFETPNPENLIVSSYSFHCDPTHRSPIYPPMVQFLAEQRGLVRVAIHPVNQHLLPGMLGIREVGERPGNSLIDVLKRHLLAAPDFALIGWKP